MAKSITRQQGFTLIEVLVAGVILITVISTMTFVYRTAVLSSSKAANSVKLSGSVGLILTTIQSKIRGSNTTVPLAGAGVINEVNYSWQSTLVENKAAPPRFNSGDGNFQSQDYRYFLWQVNLTVSFSTKTKTYEFQEISWKLN